jgi:hypothetical protein
MEVYNQVLHLNIQLICRMPFFLGTDLASGIHAKQFSDDEAEKISTFLERAYIRLNSWFQWFNSTQSGKLACSTFIFCTH